ncbi:MAG: Cof-type HAD-IIB family hydrolase [Lachnospiraceae bacterium]|jgi:Cof subfamily protein (haloacid dehalogenase superfamily)|nr:Cof-type HAD-IIB family hydrolase [Lachnospiraceae bacterium]
MNIDLKEFSKIKMIAMDLDGTLLTGVKEITPRTREVLLRASKAGYMILAATGRPASGIPKVIAEFPGIRYAVTSNGARIVDLIENKVLSQHLLSYESAAFLIDLLKDYDALSEIYYDGLGFVEESQFRRLEHYFRKAAHINYFRTTRLSVPNLMEKFEAEHRDLDKFQAVFVNESDRDEVIEILKDRPDVECSSSLENNIEVNGGGVHKGMALIELGEILGIKKDEILAFGDGTNDRLMISEVGIGVAMGNADITVKEAADYVTLSNEEDGVAAFLEKFI